MVIEDEMTKIFRAVPAACLVLLPNVPNFTIVEVSDAFLKTKSIRRPDVVGKRLFDIFPDTSAVDSLSDLTFSLLYVIEQKKPHRMAIQRDGETRQHSLLSGARYWLPENIPVLDKAGDITHIIYSIHDVTNRMVAEKHDDISKELLLKTEMTSRTYSWHWNAKTGKLRFSEAFYKFLGVPPTSLNSIDLLYSFIHDNDKEHFRLAHTYLTQNPDKFEFPFRIKTSSGSFRTCLLKGERQGNGTGDDDKGMFGHVIDITEKIELEESLKESEKLFRNAFEHSPVGMALISSDLCYMKVNTSFCEVLGYNERELLQLRVTDVTHPDDSVVTLQCFADLQSGKIKSCNHEKRYFNKQKEIIWASVSCSAITDAQDRFLYFVVQVQDITERKRVEVAFKKRKQEYQSLFEHNPDAVFSVKADGQFLTANKAACDLFGKTNQDLVSGNFYDFSRVEERALISAVFQESETGRGQNLEIEILRMNFIPAQVHITTIPIVVDGQIDGIYCIAKNLTEKHRLEKTVQVERERFFKMFTIAPVSMSILKGPLHIFEKANDVYHTLSGRSNIIGKPVRDVFPEAEGQGIFELMDQVYSTGEAYTANERLIQIDVNADGIKEDIYLNFMFQPFKNSEGQVEGIFFFGVDISAEVLARKKIEEREKQYFDLIENLPAAVFTTDRESNLQIYNKAAVSLWGSVPRPGEFWRNSWDIYAPDGLPVDDADSPVSQALSKKRPLQCGEMAIIRSDGNTRFVRPFPSPLLDANGNVTGVISVMIDITEGKETEEELKKLSLIAKRTTNAIIITDPNGKIEWVNEGFTRLTEFEFHEVLDKELKSLIPAYDPDRGGKVAVYVNEQLRRQLPFECELLKQTKTGKPIWVEVQGQPVFDANGNLINYFQVEADITERKNAYEELVKKENEIRAFAKQLNQVLEDERSRIAREIHDEFGQQLTGLKMSLSVLQKLKARDDTFEETLREMRAGLENTIQSLREFSTELRPAILDTLGMIPSIEWLVREFEKKTGIRCDLRVKVQDHTFDKSISTTYFRICQEALTNITKHAQATKTMVEITQLDGKLSLMIADDGKGITSDKMNNPYSMGLLGMRERAKLIGADLSISSQKDAGTSIKIIVKLNDE